MSAGSLRDEARFRSAFMNAAIGVAVTELSGRFLEVNPTFCEITGYSEQELLALSFVDITHPEDRDENQRLAQTLHSGQLKSRTFEKRYIKKNGEITWAQVSVSAIPDQAGNEYATVAVVQDITERKKVEEEIRLTKERLELATEAAGIGIWETDANGKGLEYFGVQWKIMGFSKPVRHPRSSEVHKKIHEDDQEPLFKGFETAFQEARDWSGEFRVIWPDNSIHWIQGRARAFYDENSKLNRILGVNFDLTQLKNSEQKLENAVQARDEFLSIASHELKTPLTTLKLQNQLRLRALVGHHLDFFHPEKIKSMLENDARQLDRLIRLIDDMLDISRIHSGKLTIFREKFDIQELTREIIDRLSTEFQNAGCEITWNEGPTIIGFWDRFRIDQVIVNLLTNAMKYGRNCPIQVVVEAHEAVTGPYVRIAVRDQGMGIAPEDQERIFNRFERAISASEVSGLGLGLYISKQIVEMHQGRITLESQPRKGSTFTVELPLSHLN
jgi:PAS domain S-box-containing protein